MSVTPAALSASTNLILCGNISQQSRVAGGGAEQPYQPLRAPPGTAPVYASSPPGHQHHPVHAPAAGQQPAGGPNHRWIG